MHSVEFNTPRTLLRAPGRRHTSPKDPGTNAHIKNECGDSEIRAHCACEAVRRRRQLSASASASPSSSSPSSSSAQRSGRIPFQLIQFASGEVRYVRVHMCVCLHGVECTGASVFDLAIGMNIFRVHGQSRCCMYVRVCVFVWHCSCTERRTSLCVRVSKSQKMSVGLSAE